MFEKILLPVGLTERDHEAVETAKELALGEKSSVSLIHVIETIRDVPFDDLEDFYSGLESKAREAMTRIAEPLHEAGLEVSQNIVYGNRPRQIVEHAEKFGIDLIVLGSRKIDPERPEEIWTTVSQQVAVLARCPVLLVK